MISKTILAGLIAVAFVGGSIATSSVAFAQQPQNPVGPIQDLEQRVSDLEDFTELIFNSAKAEHGLFSTLIQSLQTGVTSLFNHVDRIDTDIQTLQAENEQLRTELETLKNAPEYALLGNWHFDNNNMPTTTCIDQNGETSSVSLSLLKISDNQRNDGLDFWRIVPSAGGSIDYELPSLGFSRVIENEDLRASISIQNSDSVGLFGFTLKNIEFDGVFNKHYVCDDILDHTVTITKS